MRVGHADCLVISMLSTAVHARSISLRSLSYAGDKAAPWRDADPGAGTSTEVVCGTDPSADNPAPRLRIGDHLYRRDASPRTTAFTLGTDRSSITPGWRADCRRDL
jgi:hypothetical protein